jgi:hypothetical protein
MPPFGKFIVKYEPKNKNAANIADGLAEEFALSKVKAWNRETMQYTLTVSQELLVNCFRVLVARGLLPYSQVEFHFEDKVIFPDKRGYLDYWPRGFCDYTDRQLAELLTWSDK